MACLERCYSDGTSTCWKHLRLKSVSRAALFDLELLWYFVVILTPHNSPLTGKRLVWSTKCLDIWYTLLPYWDCILGFPFLLMSFSPAPFQCFSCTFPMAAIPIPSHDTFCRYFWILSFPVMIPDYFCRFLSWIPKIYLGSKESCRFPASQCLIVVLAQCRHPLFSHYHHYPMLVPLKQPLKIILSSSIIPWLLPTPTFLDEDLWFHGCCLDATLWPRRMHRGCWSRCCQWSGATGLGGWGRVLWGGGWKEKLWLQLPKFWICTLPPATMVRWLDIHSENTPK